MIQLVLTSELLREAIVTHFALYILSVLRHNKPLKNVSPDVPETDRRKVIASVAAIAQVSLV